MLRLYDDYLIVQAPKLSLGTRSGGSASRSIQKKQKLVSQDNFSVIQ